MKKSSEKTTVSLFCTNFLSSIASGNLFSGSSDKQIFVAAFNLKLQSDLSINVKSRSSKVFPVISVYRIAPIQ